MTPRRTIPNGAFREAASVMRAIAHPLRLRLLELLEKQGRANVTAMCEATGASQPVVSQQLARMRHEGVLAAEREGAQVFYRIARPEVLGILDCIRRMGRRGRSS